MPDAVRVKKRAARPLWLSTFGYFFIAGVVAILLFFLIIIVFQDERERDVPYLAATLCAAFLFGAAAVAREVVTRRARNKYLLERDLLEFPAAPRKIKETENKFTLEQNAAALRRIKRKSDDAEMHNSVAEKHLEAALLCEEYLKIADSELNKVHVGSPRLPALRNGQETVGALHKHHLSRWAEEETRRLMREANVRVESAERIEAATRALEVLNSALQIYPEERQLAESGFAVREFITSIRVTGWIEEAERAAFKEQYEAAINHYKDALFYLSREIFDESQRSLMAAKIEVEIERLRPLAEEKARRQLPNE